jgi:ABC-2 type transport system permease protein
MTTGLTGTVVLTRFILRRDWMRIIVWIAAIAVVELLTAWSTIKVYPTQADLSRAAAATHGNAAAIALNGPDQGLDTIGGQVAFQIGATGLIAVALMAVFMIGRETRAEEEAGRLDLVRAMAVGRHSAMAAALIVVAGMSAVLGALVTLGLVALGMPAGGSALFGASLCAEGLVFAGITVVAAQFTENTRVVFGSAGAVVGAAFVARAAGDIGDGTLSWFSPIGWAQKTRPYTGDRSWPLLVTAAFAMALVSVGAALSTRRDIDAGFLHPRPGPRVATPALGRPLGLAFRLQRGSLIGWSAGLFAAGAGVGWIANDVNDLVGDNQAMRKTIAQLGGVSITDSYLSTEMLFAALIATGFAIQSVLRLRGEETAFRAAPLLSTPVSRRQWVLSHLIIALGGSAVVLAAAGLGSGLTYGIVIGDVGQVPRMLGASLTYVPALWVFVGLAAALFGLIPRGVAAVWAALAGCFVIGLLGAALNLPAWAKDVSPFQHTPRLPGASPTAVSLSVLAAVAAALTVSGVFAFHRRDVG